MLTKIMPRIGSTVMRRSAGARRTFLAIIPPNESAVFSTLGKIGGITGKNAVCRSGIYFYIPGIQKFERVSHKQQELGISFDVRTSDNVFARLDIGVMYRVNPDNEESAIKSVYSLENARSQIASYVENTARSVCSEEEIDTIFSSQDLLAKKIDEVLSKEIGGHGYSILNVLVRNIEPEEEVKRAMNRINEAYRLKEAAKHNAEAHYIEVVRKAEADACRKELNGVGIGKERDAILSAYKDTMKNICNELGVSPQEIMEFTTTIQRVDAMAQVAHSENSKVLMFPTDNGGSMVDLIKSLAVIGDEFNAANSGKVRSAK